MEDIVELLDDAIDIVTSYKRRGMNGQLNEPMNYNVPKADGIHRSVWGKDISSVKPNTLKHIIYTLQMIDEDMLHRAIVALFYYWKVRKRNKISEMKRECNEILNHYIQTNTNRDIDVGNNSEMKFYLLEVRIGAMECYKLGYTSKPIKRRVDTIRSDITKNYPLVSSSVNIIEYWESKNAKEIESELKEEHDKQLGTKYYFNGSTECFTDLLLVEKIRYRFKDNW